MIVTQVANYLIITWFKAQYRQYFVTSMRLTKERKDTCCFHWLVLPEQQRDEELCVKAAKIDPAECNDLLPL